MSALSPGLYRATVRGVADVIVLIHEGGLGCTALQIEDWYQHPADTITDARPLIVLDLDTAEREYIGDLRYVADRLPEHNVHRALVHELADQIEAQLKPARIPEPGLWGVVYAHVRGTHIRQTFIRVLEDKSINWVDIEDACGVDWLDLEDPTLVREGVES